MRRCIYDNYFSRSTQAHKDKTTEMIIILLVKPFTALSSVSTKLKIKDSQIYWGKKEKNACYKHFLHFPRYLSVLERKTDNILFLFFNPFELYQSYIVSFSYGLRHYILEQLCSRKRF